MNVFKKIYSVTCRIGDTKKCGYLRTGMYENNIRRKVDKTLGV